MRFVYAHDLCMWHMHVYVWRCTPIWKSKEEIRCPALSHFIPLRQGLSLDLQLDIFVRAAVSKPYQSSCFPSQHWGYRLIKPHPAFNVGARDLEFRKHS